MRPDLVVLTNNPKVIEAFQCTEWVEGLPGEVARKARDRVHAGWRLAAHPLAGSVRLLRSPYRSLVVVQDRRVADAGHVQMIEDAVARLGNGDLLDRSPENAEDYRLLDLELVRRAIESLGN